MRLSFVVPVLVVFAAGTLSAVEPATPATRDRPPAPPAMLRPTITLDAFLDKLPGTWAGDQHMASPKKQVMTMHVTEAYHFESATKDAFRVLVGELTYTIGSGDHATTFKGVSRTWVDAAGIGHAEVEEAGQKLRYDALMSEDSHVFIPEGKGSAADSGTGVRHTTEDGVEILVVRAFQKGPGGLYVVDGKLRKVGTPAK